MIASKDDAASCNLIFDLLHKQSCTRPDLQYCALSCAIALMFSYWGTFIMQSDAKRSACFSDSSHN